MTDLEALRPPDGGMERVPAGPIVSGSGRRRRLRLGGLRRSERRQVRQIVREYEDKRDQVQSDRASYAEWSVARGPLPEKVEERIARAVPAIDADVAALTQAQDRAVLAEVAVRSEPPEVERPPYPPDEEVEPSLREQYEELMAILRDAQERLHFRHRVSKKLAWATDAVVLVADVLFFFNYFKELLDLTFNFSVDGVLNALTASLLSVVGPTIVIVCAIAIGNIVGSIRAIMVLDRLRDQQSGRVVDPAEEVSRRSAIWRFLTSALRAAQRIGMSGTLFCAVVMIGAMSTLYSVTASARLEVASQFNSDVGDGLTVMMVLFMALPIAATIVHAASANDLAEDSKDLTRRYEAELAEVRERNAATRRRIDTEHDHRVRDRQQVIARTRAESEAALTDLRKRRVALRHRIVSLEKGIARMIRDDEESKARVLYRARGEIDRMSLYPPDGGGAADRGAVRRSNGPLAAAAATLFDHPQPAHPADPRSGPRLTAREVEQSGLPELAGARLALASSFDPGRDAPDAAGGPEAGPDDPFEVS